MRRTAPTVLSVAAMTFAVLPALAPAPAGAVEAAALLSSTFDRTTAGWYAQTGAALTLVPGAARVTATAAGPVVLDDAPASVTGTQQGGHYRVQARVRSSTAGLPVELRVQEYAADSLGSSRSTVAAGALWTTVTAEYEAATDGASLGVNLTGGSTRAGQSFEVDDVRVTMVSGGAWRRVFRDDFTTMAGVSAWNSSTELNTSLRADDKTNDRLQKPTVKDNVTVTADPAAGDGQALGVYTRKAAYRTASGVKVGWANGRMALRNQDAAPPFHVRTRLKMTASVGVKSAVMWWPSGGGWPWEVDFVETFGGDSLTDYWGSRQHVSQRWHADLNKDGRAKEQLIHNDTVDATKYHVYDLFVTGERMWVEIDGTKTFETTDRRYLPRGPGFFTIGKALTGPRDSAARTEDVVLVDWVEIYKPAS